MNVGKRRIDVTVSVPEAHIENAIVSAVEGGHYGMSWGTLVFVEQSRDEPDLPWYKCPLDVFGAVWIFDHDDGKWSPPDIESLADIEKLTVACRKRLYRLDFAAIKRGLELCPRKLLFKLIDGNEMDAPASERFLQWCLFGKEIYG